MKRLGHFFVLVAVLATSGLAMAQIDPEENSIGIYFDIEATIHRITLLPGEHHAYLALTTPTDPTGVSGWECRITSTGPAFILDWGILGMAINASAPPNFMVGLAEPFPFNESIIVMDMLFLMTGMEEVQFFIHPSLQPSIDGVPAYASGANPELLHPLRQSTGGEEFPVAVVNGDAPVATEGNTWGGVKTLYH